MQYTKMQTIEIIALLFVLISFTSKTMSVNWASQTNHMFKRKTTDYLANFSPSPELIDSIASGTTIATDQCKEVFKWDRWNCPASAFSKKYKHSIHKEAAYVQAITAAGIVYAVTKSCSKGEIFGCGCDFKRNGPVSTNISGMLLDLEQLEEKKQAISWSWGGCSDSTSFAENVAQHVLNDYEDGNDAQAQLIRHNHAIGRKIVRESMTTKCRCHGMSASCSMQTCTMELAPFPEIANELKKLYRRAKIISFENVAHNGSKGNVAQVSITKLFNPRFKSLVYLEQSPNYCKADASTDWPGTKGRQCSRTSKSDNPTEKRSCRNICRDCGYRVLKEKKEVTYQCKCAFKYCCNVLCETCTKTVETFFCG